jgi:hypothetical protein
MYGELVHVELAEHHRAGGPEIGGHRRFVDRLEAVEDVAPRLAMHAFGAEKVLDAERHAFEHPRFAPAEPLVGLGRHGKRLVRCLEDIGVQRPRLLHVGEICLGQFRRGEGLLGEAIADLGNGQQGEVAHRASAFS